MNVCIGSEPNERSKTILFITGKSTSNNNYHKNEIINNIPKPHDIVLQVLIIILLYYNNCVPHLDIMQLKT